MFGQYLTFQSIFPSSISLLLGTRAVSSPKKSEKKLEEMKTLAKVTQRKGWSWDLRRALAARLVLVTLP